MEQFNKSLPRVNTNIRIIHANPTTSNIDVYANGSLVASNIAFGKISKYLTLTPGEYNFQLYPTGTYDTPMLSQDIQLIANANYTISFVALSNNPFLFRLKDDNIATTRAQAYLRFINLSQNSPLLSLSLPNNFVLFNSAEFLETTGYYQLSPGIYNFEVSFGSSDVTVKYIKNLTLEGGKLYTIYVLGVFNGKPVIGYLLTEDLI